MKKLTFLFCMLLAIACSGNAIASMTGTLYSNQKTDADTSGGLVAINALVGSLTWEVDQGDGGLWQYTYTLNPYVDNKNNGVGSINLEFGDATYLAWEYTYVGLFSDYMGVARTDETVQTVDRTPGASTLWDYDSWLCDDTSVNVTTTFEGLQWITGADIPDSDPLLTYHFGSDYIILQVTTDLAPEWGNIYFDGFNQTTNNGYGMIRNTNYDTDAATAFIYDESFVYETSTLVGWVPTPNAAAVPLPPSLLLLVSGLGGFILFKRKSRLC